MQRNAIRALFPLIGILLIIPVLGCTADGETVTLVIGGAEVVAEVVRTPEDRATGLMNRKELGADEGMIFVYEADTKMSFYMKNTYIPLSIAFLAKDGTIREIYDMKPLSLRTINSRYSVRYALEMNQGAFERLGVGPGDVVKLPDGF